MKSIIAHTILLAQICLSQNTNASSFDVPFTYLPQYPLDGRNDHPHAYLGPAAQDPFGLQWFKALRDFDGTLKAVYADEADRICRNLGTRLPHDWEFRRLDTFFPEDEKGFHPVPDFFSDLLAHYNNGTHAGFWASNALDSNAFYHTYIHWYISGGSLYNSYGFPQLIMCVYEPTAP